MALPIRWRRPPEPFEETMAIETGRNVVHGSDSATSAAREIALHFSKSELVIFKRIDEAWLYE